MLPLRNPKLRLSCLIITICLSTSACSSLPSWLGGGKKSFEPVPGERVAVLTGRDKISPDESLASSGITLPEAVANKNWPQHLGGASANLQHVSLNSSQAEHSASAGEGNEWGKFLAATPIIVENTLYAMDGLGYVSAHDATSLTRRWVSSAAVEEDEPKLIGGGLAYDNSRLVAVTGQGLVVAFNTATGKEVWKQALKLPVRSAPKMADGRIFVVTADNQLFALDSANGTVLWNHRGIGETASFLASVSPAVSGQYVVAPYSSGEIHVLRADTGEQVWSDSLAVPQHTEATGLFSGIGGDPVVFDNVVYAASSDGFLTAARLETGQTLWEQRFSALNTPWIAGDNLFVLTTDNQLVCLNKADGRIRWISPLQNYQDEENRKNPLDWSGPILAGGKLLVTGAHGVMLRLNPENGKEIDRMEISDGVAMAPVIAGGRIYLMNKDSSLYSY